MLLLKKNDVNMLSGPILKGLLTIAIPIMIMNVVQSLFNIVDLSVLKMYDSDGGYTVGAVGTCGTLISLVTGLLIGISSGANVIIARSIGKGDKEGVERAVGTAVTFSVLGGLLLSLIGIPFAEIFLEWMNCPEKLLPQAVLYFRLYFAGVPILMVYNFCASVLRSTGDSRRPMIFLTLSGLLKVLLNFVFVAGFDMKVVGVALASIISWILAASLALIALLKNKSIAKLKTNRLHIYGSELKEMLIIGVPTGLQQALYSIANVIITATVNSFGPDATTGISIANNFDGILYQIVMAPALAVMPYVSQNIGNHNTKRAAKAVLQGVAVTTVLGSVFGALSAIFSPQLASIMSDNPIVIGYAQQKMIIISSTYFLCGINEIFGAALRAMRKPLIPTCSTMIFMCAIRFVWVYIFFPLNPNLTFLYLIWPIGWTLSLITLLFFYFPSIKRLSYFDKSVSQSTQTT